MVFRVLMLMTSKPIWCLPKDPLYAFLLCVKFMYLCLHTRGDASEVLMKGGQYFNITRYRRTTVFHWGLESFRAWLLIGVFSLYCKDKADAAPPDTSSLPPRERCRPSAGSWPPMLMYTVLDMAAEVSCDTKSVATSPTTWWRYVADAAEVMLSTTSSCYYLPNVLLPTSMKRRLCRE